MKKAGCETSPDLDYQQEFDDKWSEFSTEGQRAILEYEMVFN